MLHITPHGREDGNLGLSFRKGLSTKNDILKTRIIIQLPFHLKRMSSTSIRHDKAHQVFTHHPSPPDHPCFYIHRDTREHENNAIYLASNRRGIRWGTRAHVCRISSAIQLLGVTRQHHRRGRVVAGTCGGVERSGQRDELTA